MIELSILVTCPPMLGMKEQFLPFFEDKGIKVVMPEFVQVMTEDELCEILPNYDGWIIGDDPATSRVLKAGKNGRLKAVVKWGVGVDNVDFDACNRLDLPVSNTPAMFGKEVADMALGYIIGLARHTFEIDRSIREGKWLKVSGMSLAGKTIGIVGFGDIGRNLVSRVIALGMIPIIYDPFADKKEVQKQGGLLADWPDKLGECDFLAFCCALTQNNTHMLNSKSLKKCKPGVRIVNVARGPLIDQDALESALDKGLVHSVALDVFEVEPLPEASQLRHHNQCILGSHNSSNTKEAVEATNIKAIDLLLGFLGV